MALDYVQFAASQATLWVNLALYAPLLLVALALTPGRLARAENTPQAASTMLLLFAAARVGWAIYLASCGRMFSKHLGMARTACLVDALCTTIYFMLAGLLLVQVADYLTTGWKSSQRLWRIFFFFSAAWLPFLAALLVVSHDWHSNPDGAEREHIHKLSQGLMTVQNVVYAVSSAVSALLLSAIWLRFLRVETPRVLLHFVQAPQLPSRPPAEVSVSSTPLPSVKWIALPPPCPLPPHPKSLPTRHFHPPLPSPPCPPSHLPSSSP